MTAESEYFEKLFNEKIKRLDDKFELEGQAQKERDRRYEDRFKSQEQAVAKAEKAQSDYNVTHNDLIRKQDNLIPRQEADARFKNIGDRMDNAMKEIAGLRESRSSGSGEKDASRYDRTQNQYWIALAVGIISAAIGYLINR